MSIPHVIYGAYCTVRFIAMLPIMLPLALLGMLLALVGARSVGTFLFAAALYALLPAAVVEKIGAV